MNIDAWAHVAEIVIAFPVAWKVFRAASRVESLLQDYPPHRHANGKILYPPAYQPGKVESLGFTRQSTGSSEGDSKS